MRAAPAGRTANFPGLVLRVAAGHAALEGVDATRAEVLTAAARVALHFPPPAPVAYPSLLEATAQVRVPLPTRGLYEGARLLEADFFYHRFPWLVFYGLATGLGNERLQSFIDAARREPEALAVRDRAAYENILGGQPCRIPTTPRAPGTERSRPR